ncbi:type VI secretion system membrane subunit TssM [Pseudomonas gingeri]|uniref:Type VI secretion system membrane subunit TssM n=2 Tax=Pseudomonas gingeri TaxID=117681 RepID=A0A7Y7Y9Y1_9PSED|nr:type VI secretion system membrane subunit TssM [Pseudomonas gingeri]NWC32352.1 type VI secretion system membrane subunit TssM [Pseudomonas gingeri]NWD04695.1 type VI secretion system membrane subunit TssM [Pseudomonas gingeri]NWE30939.1 type VI secretion system membrane subunit TssM [Pseudomonas gingeri]NWE59001.1 type VI secretion system membrane subunit TssM [Pseudomonas gingeri]
MRIFMKRYFLWLVKPWFLSLLGVLLLSLLVWYEGPLLAFNGHEPLAPEAWRWRLILLLLLLWAGYFAWKLFQAWQANRVLMAGVGGQDQTQAIASTGARESEAEVAVLGERMRAAMAVLRKANPGWKMSGQYLYQLPWYMFVGAPGSGKTTALTHSGLQFPLSDALGAGAIGGVGGTRHCDWWFTDEAVLLDTAGRFTTQDSHGEVDKAAWLGFLDLLKKHRRRRPVNGVIVALSVSDLLQQGEAQRQVQALAIRARINELHERLGLRFPVYVIITKCDLMAGFSEFFESFGREERSQVWGVTFPLAQAGQGGQPDTALAAFPAEFDVLERQLHVRLLERVQQERDLSRRALLYSFPQQFAGIGEGLTRFLNTVFESNRYQEPALLRGVYFTSGTQEGSPIDRVLASLAASFGLSRKVLPPNAASGRSYFITRLMREVIFKEAGLAGVNPREERRRRLFERGGLALAGVLVVLLGMCMTISYNRNQAFIDTSLLRTHEVGQLAHDLPGEGNVLVTLALLNAARDLPAGFAARDQGVPLLNRMGLYQGDKLGVGAVNLYRRLLRGTLLPQIVANMESALRRGDTSNQDFLYETLRAYLMLGERQYFDAASVQAWVDLDWRRDLPQATEEQRQQLSAHVSALLDANDEEAEPVQLDTALVAKVRLALASMPLSQRIYNRLKRQVAEGNLPEPSVSGAVGRDVSPVFKRQSGAPLSRGVSGVYSIAGYRLLASKSAAAVADMAKDSWVLDRQESLTTQGDSPSMNAAVLQLYYADYIRQWDAYLDDVRLVPLTSLDQAARVTNALGAGDSPLRQWLQAVARETTLDGVLNAPLKDRLGAALPSGRLADAKKKLESVLGQGDAPAAADPGGNPVDLHFAALHKLVGDGGSGPIDEVVASMKDAAQYFDSADSARRSGAPAPSGEVLTRLKRAGDVQPAPVSALLRDVESGGNALTLGNERARLNALWEASGAPFCRDAIAGRYPLVRGSSRDATADDFGKFFAPGGIMDDFFSKNLQAYVDMSGSQWRWRATSAATLSIPQDVLNQFQRGARLRDMFFVAGAHQPSLHFDLKAVSADPALSKVTLDIDGQPVVFDVTTPSNFTPIVLPSGKGGDLVRFDAIPPLNSLLRADGPWAWLHLVDKGVLESEQGENYRLTFSLDGRKVVYELRASSVINPFRRDALEQFRCPASL